MDIEVIKSDRRSVRIEIKQDGSVLVRAPKRLSRFAINTFINEKMDWIEKTRASVMEKNAGLSTVSKLSPSELTSLKKKARDMILPLLEDYAEEMGVTYGTVSIRAQKTRWGSCTSEGNLNFNCLLALCPEGVMRYVVVHELSHRHHMDHSKAFWQEVSEFMPDYRQQKLFLKNNGSRLLAMLP